MRPVVVVAFVVAVAAPVAAQTVRAPRLTPGDSWTYANGTETRGTFRTTHDVLSVIRADKSLIAVEVHAVGATAPGPERLFGPDWSRVRSVNGRQTVVNQPLSYPMAPGKSWAVAYDETTPANRAHTREGWRIVLQAVGWQDITVPAGTFHALKIEGDGTWTADLPANTLTTLGRTPNGGALASRTNQMARTVSGRFLKAFWYVPEVGRWIKAEEDIYDTNGIRTEHVTADLEAFSREEPVSADAPVADTPAHDALPPRRRHSHISHPAPAHAAKAPATPHPAKRSPAPPAFPPLQETRMEGRRPTGWAARAPAHSIRLTCQESVLVSWLRIADAT